MKTRRRLLSILLVLALVFGIVPLVDLTAFADTVGGVGIALISASITPISAPIPGNEPIIVHAGFARRAIEDAVETAREAGADIATVRIRSVGKVPLESLQTMAAADMPVRFHADSMDEDGRGRSVDVRITLDPALSTQDLNLYASTTNARAIQTTRVFERFFDNNVRVISLGQQGSFGQEVTVAARIPVPAGFNLYNFAFYSYDRERNQYYRFTPGSIQLDTGMYLHFTTMLAGDIIITTSPLVRR